MRTLRQPRSLRMALLSVLVVMTFLTGTIGLAADVHTNTNALTDVT